jgi:energy-coupling factor transporter ATP-binding protein EcfA2
LVFSQPTNNTRHQGSAREASMIRSISIKSFKSLLDVEVELGRVNVFVGANGSGKSNLLEAIGVLGAAANGRVDDESLKHRGVRPGVPALYKSSFRGHRGRSTIRLQAISLEKASYSVELNNPIKDPAPAWRFMTETVDEDDERLFGRSHRSKEKFNPERGLAALNAVSWEPGRPASKLIVDLANYSIYSPNTNTLRGLTPDPQQREPVGLAGGRLPQAVFELEIGTFLSLSDHKVKRSALKEVLGLIDWAESFGSRMVGKIPLSPSVATVQQVVYFIDRFMAEGRNGLTGYDASEGALYVLYAAVLALHPKAPSLLAIDNLDHGLNPRLARALMSRLCEWVLDTPTDKQLLLTTHNPLALDGLPLDNDDVRLFAVGRSRKGRTTVNRIKVHLDDLRRDGELWTVSRLWVMGHLGGMPDV